MEKIENFHITLAKSLNERVRNAKQTSMTVRKNLLPQVKIDERLLTFQKKKGAKVLQIRKILEGCTENLVDLENTAKLAFSCTNGHRYKREQLASERSNNCTIEEGPDGDTTPGEWEQSNLDLSILPRSQRNEQKMKNIMSYYVILFLKKIAAIENGKPNGTKVA